MCERCVVFTTRPLSKIELLKLKAKDLIFYLQSKHISTTGCVGEYNGRLYDAYEHSDDSAMSTMTTMTNIIRLLSFGFC